MSIIIVGSMQNVFSRAMCRMVPVDYSCKVLYSMMERPMVFSLKVMESDSLIIMF